MLKHGGRLIEASKKYNRPVFDWLDLSTGINPIPYPVPEIKADVWRRLPQDDDGLLIAASSYYDTNILNLLETSGSQAAIQTIPLIFKTSRVGLMQLSYNEHKHAWQQAGHEVIHIGYDDLAAQCTNQNLDVLLICNPNNPTGDLVDLAELEECLQAMSQKSGTVLIDEAFMDSTPEKSALPLLKKFPDTLIVLRSLGKFFGLAGARVGFVAASQRTLSALQERLGPWTVSGPSRFAAYHALMDTKWQTNNRLFLKSSSQKLREALSSVGCSVSGYTDYFAYVEHSCADLFHETMCKAGVLTRLFDQPNSLRFGLPADDDEIQWLKHAINSHFPEAR